MMDPIIKKLPKALIAEGLTVEMVNRLQMDRNYTPIQLEAGDEPMDILLCLKGFFGKAQGEKDYLRNEDGSYMVFPRPACRIGRARYLMNHAAEEKAKKVQAQLDAWKKLVRKQLDNLQGTLKAHKNYLSGKGFSSLELVISKNEAESYVKRIEPELIQAEEWYEAGKLEPMLQAFGIVNFEGPMHSAKLDDKESMRILKELFSADALKKWDGDMLRKYAEIEVEKQY